jgi:phosphatidylethanolamine-binding protein (PEBP) family uncharacterized protein
MKKLFTLLIALCSFLSWSFGQVYVHNFSSFLGSAATTYNGSPNTLDANLTTTGWSVVGSTVTMLEDNSPPPGMITTGNAFRLNNAGGNNPTLTLTLNVACGYKLDISEINFLKRRNSTGSNSVQVLVNTDNYGTSSGITGATSTFQRTNTKNNLTGTVTIDLVFSGGSVDAGSNDNIHIDEFKILGTVTKQFNMTGVGVVKFCNLDITGTRTLGLDGSVSGINYELYKDGLPLSPTPNVVVGTGAALTFGNYRASGTYTVVQVSAPGCLSPIAMSGQAVLSNHLNPTAATWGSMTAGPICSGSNYPINITVTGGTAPFNITFSSNPGGNVNQTIAASPGTVTLVPVVGTTTYSSITIVDDNQCPVAPAGNPTNTLSITVNPVPTASISGSATVCRGASTNLTITAGNMLPNTAFSGTLSSNGGSFSGTSDAMGTASITVSVTSPDVTAGATETYNIATFVSGGCSASPTGSAVITIESTPPSVSCAGAPTTLNTAPACTAALTYSATITDNCTVVPQGWTITGATTANAIGSNAITAQALNTGSNVVTFTATDNAGTSATCQFTVMVSDATPPIVTCPTNPGPFATPLVNDPSQSYATVASLVFSATDNCSNTTGSVVLSGNTTGTTTSGTGNITLTSQQFNIGSTLVTYSVTDAAGLTSTCAFTVYVNDNQSPLFFPCPSDKTGTTNAPTCAYTPASPYTVTMQDNNIASVSVFYTLSGANTLPGLNAMTTGVPSGNQNTFTLPVIAYNKGVTTVTLTSVQGTLQSICSFTVTVTDDDAPSITSCPSSASVFMGSGVCTYAMPVTAIGFTDNCPMANLNVSVNNGSSVTFDNTGITGGTLNKGANVFTVTATDAASLTATCSFTITVSDNQAPSFTTCPANQTFMTGAGATTCNKVVTGLTAAATDNCTLPATPITKQYISGPTVSFSSTNGNDASGTYGVGTTVVRFTVTDASSNTATCDFSITVVDNTAPVITGCPSNQSFGVDLNECNSTKTFSVTASDNCSTNATWAITGATTASGSGVTTGSRDFLVGVSTVTFSVTDNATPTANTSTCQFTVTVTDNQAPTVTCQSAVSVNTTTNLCTNTQTITATPADFCGATNTTYTMIGSTTGTGTGSSFTQAFNRGGTIVTFTTTAPGGSSSCQVFVTVTDNQAPVAICPANVAVGTDGSSCTSGSITIPAMTPTDNCSIASSSFTRSGASTTGSTGVNASGTYNKGVTTVTFTTTDIAGNSSACSFTVTVNDDDAPSVVCPSNIVTTTATGICTKNINFAAVSSMDNCAVTATSWTSSGATIIGTTNGASATGITFNKGTSTVTFTVADAAGNTGTCSFDVEVNDEEAPSVSCPPSVTVGTNAGCTYVIPSPLAISAMDNCTDLTISWAGSHTSTNPSPASGNASSLTSSVASSISGTLSAGVTTYTVTAIDDSGNESDCSFTVTVTDDDAPTQVSCPPSVLTANMDAGVCYRAETLSASFTDNCTPAGSLTYAWTITNGSSTIGTGTGATITAFQYPKGTNVGVFTVKDAANNSSTCQFSLQVNDNQPPVINNCPSSNLPQLLSLSAPIANVNLVTSNNGTGNCDANHTFTLGVSDNCPSNLVITWTVTSGMTTVGTGTGATINIDLNVGNYTVLFTATDGTNTETCSYTVAVKDDEKPSITCPSPAPVNTLANATTCDATVTIPVATAMDNCDVSLDFSYVKGMAASVAGNNASGTYPVGTTVVTFTATDDAGNTKTCSFSVVVNDATTPVITCPASTMVNAAMGLCTQNVTGLTASATDNCTMPITNYSYVKGSNPSVLGNNASGTYSLGMTTITFTATDGVGNTKTCSFTVTVVDHEAPSVSCPSSAVVNTDAGVCTKVYSVTPTVVENCSNPVTYAWSVTGATSATGTSATISATLNKGVNTIAFSVTDAAGNTNSSCSYTITVEDHELPVIVCPSNQIVATGTDAGQCYSAQSYPITVTDNCGGAGLSYVWTVTQGVTTVSSGTSATVTGNFPKGISNVTFVASDGAIPGPNSQVCTFTVSVVDDEFPVILGIANLNRTTNAAMCKWSGSLGTVTATDNCMGLGALTNNAPSSFPIGSTIVIWTVTDAAGNTTTATQTVNVTSTLMASATTPVVVCAQAPLALNATITGGTTAYSFAWTGPLTYSSSAEDPTVSASATVGMTGTYNFTVTDANGCTATSSVAVTVHALPTITLPTAPVDIVCNDASAFGIPFTGNTGNQYTIDFTSPSIPDITTFTGYNTSPIAISIPSLPNSSVTYNFTLLVKSTTTGCISNPVNSSFRTNTRPTGNLAFVPIFPKDVVCNTSAASNIRVNLTGVQPWTVTYSINGVNTTQSTTSSPLTISAPAAGIYNLVDVTDASSCSANPSNITGSATVRNAQFAITQQPASPTLTVCSGSTISLSALAGYFPTTTPTTGTIAYKWQRYNPSIPGFEDISGVVTSTYSPTVTMADNGTRYRLKGFSTATWQSGILTTGTCEDEIYSSEVLLTVVPAITGFTAGPDQLTISGNTTTLAGSLGTGTSGVWSVVSPNTFSASNIVTTTNPTATVNNIPLGSVTLRFTVSNAGCSASDDVVLTRTVIKLNVIAALEGPLNLTTGEMNINIRSIIPADGNGYPSTTLRNVTGLQGIVDWVSVELRTTAATPATGNFVRQGLIRSDGRIVEPADGTSPLSFDVPNGSYFVVVKHRNHLGFRSATAQALTATALPYTLDFATGITLAHNGGDTGLKFIIAIGVYCAYAGNADGNSIINSTDYNLWRPLRFQSGYLGPDWDLSGTVNSADYALWLTNRFKTEQF